MGGAPDDIEAHCTYGQVIQRAAGVVFQVEVLEFQLERATMTGFQPPVAFGAVVVGHRVVGRCEHPCGGGEITSTACRGTQWMNHSLFLLQDKPRLKHLTAVLCIRCWGQCPGPYTGWARALPLSHAPQACGFQRQNSLHSPGLPPTWNPPASASWH